jgi:hypothetical protein
MVNAVKLIKAGNIHECTAKVAKGFAVNIVE